MERTDIRALDPAALAEPPDVVTIDVSFISFKLVLPAAIALAARPADIVALIKPQFEVTRADTKKGIVRDPEVHRRVCEEIAGFADCARPHGDRPVRLAHRRRRRQPRILHRRPTLVEHLTIDHIGRHGDGVALTKAGPVYVPYTLPGEIVEVEPWPGHPDRAPSAARRDCEPRAHRADLPAFRRLRRLRAPALADGALSRLEARPRGRRAAPGRHRGGGRRPRRRPWRRTPPRRAACPRRHAHDVLEVGFAARQAHRIVPIDRCPILAPGLAGVIEAAWAIAEALRPAGKPLDIQATATDAGIDVDIRGSGPLDAAAVARARARRRGPSPRPHHPPWRTGRATRDADGDDGTLHGGVAARCVSAGDRREGEATLARLVLAHAGTAKAVADLFAGVGPFALRLAEARPRRRRRCRRGRDRRAHPRRRRHRGLKPIRAERRDLFRRPLIAKELAELDAVVFDPPRQGAEAQARELATGTVATVVAVSCNAATFARDAKLLIDGGYRMAEVTPVDQFRYSAHVEIVAKLAR